MTRPHHRILKLALLCLFLLSINGKVFSKPVHAAAVLEQVSFTLDGVSLVLRAPFIPGKFTTATEQDYIQMATAARMEPYAEISLTVIPYDTKPVTENLPAAQPGIAETYLQMLRQERVQSGGTVVTGPTASLLGRSSTALASMVSIPIKPNQPVPVLVVEWVFEAGDRVWILRINQLFDSSSTIQAQTEPLAQVKLESPAINTPSASLAFQEEYFSAPELPTIPEPPIGALASDLPFPGWWDGECDINYYQPRSGMASYPLGASYRGVKACGPRPYLYEADNPSVNVIVRFFPGAHGEYEWQCVELSMRFMYLAYGINPYPGNGLAVVNNYTGTRLVKIANDTVGQPPMPGDVISYGTTGVGHTSVVMASDVDANGNGTVTILEQNNRVTGTQTHTVTNWHVYAYTLITGWLHEPSTVSDITLNNNTILENQPAGTRVGAFTSTGDDPNATYTYSLVSGEGSDENIFFQISGNKLNTIIPFNHEVYDRYRIRVRSISSSGGSLEKPFMIQSVNVNEAPTGLAVTPSSFVENIPVGSTVGTLSTTDEDIDDTHTYSFVTGTGDKDNTRFTIQDNQLLTNAAFNYEAANTFSVRIKSTDSGGLSKTAILSIAVTNQNEPPTNLSLSNNAIDEDVLLGTTVGTFATTDEDLSDSHTYTLVSGEGSADNGNFTISGASLLTGTTFDYQTQQQHYIRVRTTDSGGLHIEKTFIINILDINVPPTNLTLSGSTIQENLPAGTLIGVLNTVDPDPDNTHTYTLVSGTGSENNAAFNVVGNQLLSAQSYNFETQGTLNLRLRTTDNYGSFFEKAFTVSVTDINEPPTSLSLSKNTINENQPAGTSIGVFSMADPDLTDSHTFQLVSGEGDTHNSLFHISGAGLLTKAVFNFEQQAAYTIRVQGSDQGGLTLEKAFQITINNRNDPPTNILLSSKTIPENQPVGTVIGTFSTTDEDAGDTHTYRLVAGSGDQDNARFAISSGKLKTNAVLNYEEQAEYRVRVSTTDSGGAVYEKAFTITALNANDPPVGLTLDSTTVTEHQPIGTLVGRLSVTDEDQSDTHTFTLVPGTGDSSNALFSIAGDLLRTNADFDFDLQETHSIRVRATDSGGLSVEKKFTITILDANQKPTDLRLSSTTINENKPAGTVIGQLYTIDPNLDDEHTYTLVDGDGSDANSSFHITGDQLFIDEATNYETRSSYPIRIRTTDREGLFLEKTFVISVNNLNEPPTEITLSNHIIDENSPIGTTVGLFSTEDEDLNDQHTYKLVAGAGSADNAHFKILSGALLTQTSIDYETKSTYQIRVRSTDSSSLSVEKSFVISVRDVNEIPEDLSLSGTQIEENVLPGHVFGNFTVLDPDLSDSHTFELVEGEGAADNDSFAIQDGQLLNSTAFDYETQTSCSIRVRVTDSGGLFIERQFTISILPVNEYPPTEILLSGSTVPESFPPGTLVGLLNAADLDHGDPHIFELAAGSGDADNDLFRVEDNRLLSNAVFDYEIRNEYSIRLRVTDSGGLHHEQQFTIQVLDRLETFLPLMVSQYTSFTN